MDRLSSKPCRCLHCIVPPHMLRHLLDNGDPAVRAAALSTLLGTERLRGARAVRERAFAAPAPAGGRRTIYDCRNATDPTLAVIARTEDQAAVTDVAVNQAYDGLGATRDFYGAVFRRDSIDGRGMRLDGYVHRGVKYNNAFWDGQEMVFGDGDGVIFTDFTGSIDVIGHELTHGVTQFMAGLEYHDQPGALNESISDVFGSLVKQWHNGQTADQADWLIGPDIFTPDVAGDALRSMKAPGTAYDDPRLGKDPQPADMAHYARLPNTDDGDNGGVHINSGIPNRAFYLAATGIGGNAWEQAGHIWYEALGAAKPASDFQAFADGTYVKATQLHGGGSVPQKAVLDAWATVGIAISGAVIAGQDGGRPAVKLTVATHGGWTGRFAPAQVIDTAALPPAAAAACLHLVQAAEAGGGAERQAMQGHPAPEAQRYTITIEDGARTATMRLSDTDADPAARALLDWVQAQAG